ncbi:MAG: phosphate signaling complex protein PhoU [Vicinamibacteraceae bacterium]
MTQNASPFRPFLAGIDELKRELSLQGTTVAARLAQAIGGFATRDLHALDEVAIGDGDVNARQMAIDDRAFKLLALQQPVAIDLRVIVAAIKVNADLERIGDLAVNIAEASRRYLDYGAIAEEDVIPRMADVAQAMLHWSIDAFVAGNVGLAQSVLERDDILDTLRDQAFRKLADTMARTPACMPSTLELMLLTRHLERIGDHATNIAEDVFFVVAGEDVRHHAHGLAASE